MCVYTIEQTVHKECCVAFNWRPKAALFKCVNSWYYCQFISRTGWINIPKLNRKVRSISDLVQRLCGGHSSRRGDVKVVTSAMLHRCSATSAHLSTKAGVYFAPESLLYDEWPIDWSRTRVGVGSRQRQRYLINIWFLLLSWGVHGGPIWPRTPRTAFSRACRYHWQAILRTARSKTTGSAAGSVSNEPVLLKCMFRKERKCRHRFDDVTQDPTRSPPLCASQGQWPSFKRLHSGSAGIRGARQRGHTRAARPTAVWYC